MFFNLDFLRFTLFFLLTTFVVFPAPSTLAPSSINEFSNTENGVKPTIIKENDDIKIDTITLNKKKLLIKINEINNLIIPTEDFSNENLNFRIKLSSDKFTLANYYDENIITNFTKGKIINFL